jgi:hypothetical protein
MEARGSPASQQVIDFSIIFEWTILIAVASEVQA